MEDDDNSVKIAFSSNCNCSCQISVININEHLRDKFRLSAEVTDNALDLNSNKINQILR